MKELQFAEFRPVDRKAVLLLNRPPLNILNQAMCEELTGFLKTLPLGDYDGLLITTEGKHFSAGADIGEHFPGKVWEMLPKFDELLLTLAEFPLPTVAAITGNCLGGGLELARACRKVIAWTPETVVLGVPEIKLACFPPFGLAVFPRLIDMEFLIKKIISFLITGEIIKGGEKIQLNFALASGLVDDAFLSTLDELVEQQDFSELAGAPSISKRFQNPILINESMIQEVLVGKEKIVNGFSHHALKLAINVLIYCSQAPDLRTALGYAEHIYLTKLANHRDYHEGLTAFTAEPKRQPVYVRTGL